MIRAEVTTDTNFDLTALSSNSDVSSFLSGYTSMDADAIRSAIETLYLKYGSHKPLVGGIDGSTNKKTYLFYTDISASTVNGICSLNTATMAWGNHYVIFNSGLSSKRTVIHECGHSFSLPHIFSASLSPFDFYQGYCDNYMDYNWQKRAPAPSGGYYSSGDNVYKGNMYSLFKWQWEIIRGDRSLIFTY